MKTKRTGKILSLILAVCMVFTMLPMAAFAETLYAANKSVLPIPGDVLEIAGSELKDGVPVFDLGDYDDFLTNGERFPITINRPKGSEAGYSVSARLASYNGSNANGFQIFDSSEGDDPNNGFIEFPPNVTSKTIYIGDEYYLGDNTLRSGMLSSYIYFSDFDKTTLDTPIIRLETTKAKSAGGNTADLLSVVYALVESTTPSVKLGASNVISATFVPTKSIYQQDKGFCEITGDLTLNLTNGTHTLKLKPVEAVGSILSDVTFVIPPNATVDENWEVFSITGIKNAKDGSSINLMYSDDDDESNIYVSEYTFLYEKEPVFGPVTTDKESYKGLENIQVSMPVQNADLINFGDRFDNYWREQIGLSYDGGQSIISPSLMSWDSQTNSIETAFPAPANNTGSPMKIAVEVYLDYGELGWKVLFGAFKIITISAETGDFVPIESITVTGIPASNIEKDKEYPLEVKILPENASFSGYTWETSNSDRASVTDNKLVFGDDGKVTITLRSDEAAYRMAQGLPANDVELVKTFTFAVGDLNPRLITSSIQLGKSGGDNEVTALFNDNFDIASDEGWKNAVLTYEICDAAGTVKKSGEATRENRVTKVGLIFDDITPKTASPYIKGEFKPAYTIKLTATAGALSVSATANVYITPPPVAMEWLTETSNALVGEPATFTFKIKNLLSDYKLSYKIMDASGGQQEGVPTNPSEEIDPTTRLITLTGSVVFTPLEQGDVSGFGSITVYANNNNEDEKKQSISKRINILNPSAALMSVKFYDGFDGTVIAPEAGDTPDEFYGVRESKVAALTVGSDYSSKEVFEYLNRMMRPKTLDIVVPWEWGQIKAEGVILPATEGRSSYISLSDADKGKEITLSWENVKTKRKFVFNEDNLSQKAYAFWLENALDSQPVEISYKNGNNQSVQKSVIPYNGYAIIYEPSGIKGEVWISQKYAGSYGYASVTNPRGISSQYGLSPLIVSSIASNYRYNYQTLSSNAVIMSANPVAKFQRAGFDVPTVVRYCAVDKDRKIIAGTNGKVTPQGGSGNFELPFKALYENQNSHLMVEYEYLAGKETRTQLEYYYLDTLEENLRYGKANSYASVVSSYIQRLSVIGVDGEVQNFPAQSNKFITINPGDAIELQLATGARAINRAELKLLNHRQTVDANGNVGGWIFDYTKDSPAVSIEETDFSAFTPNKYTTLRFSPTREQMTLGRISQIRLVTVFNDGTSDVQNVCWGKIADEETAANIAKISDILKKQDFFHDDQMVFRVGDLKVRDNTRNAMYNGARYTFNEKVAEEIDKIKVNLATPSKNPFTYEVKREGDEYIIRGYVNVDWMNKAGMVHLADRWSDATFDELFNETKRYVIQSKTKYRPNFPGTKGYVEGKAIITPSGDIQFSFHEGRAYVESDFFHKPKELFDLPYYCKWTAVFEGQITSIFEIKPPDNGGDSKAVFNFNLEESSWVDMNTRTAHNGLSLDLGVYAVKVSLAGKIEDANYIRKTIHRPYAADALKIQWEAKFSTGGDLYERNYNRLITGPSDVDIEEGNMKKWYSWFKKPGKEPFYRTHDIKAASPGWGTSKASFMGVISDSASAGVYHQDDMLMLAAADAFSLAARGGDALRLNADELSAVQYYNGGKGIVYMDSASNIVTSSIDGNDTETVDGKAFGLYIASAENGNTVASWGSYKDDLDTDALDDIGKGGIIKYAAGKTEIKAGILNGNNWAITTLTDNEMADIMPKAATKGTEGVVVWTQGILNDNHLEGELPVIAFSESRLMFARYNGSAWDKPAVLYTPSGESIADYSVAMADDGSALVTVVMGSGKIAMVRISKGGEVTVINNSLPTTTKASLVYNGENYVLACLSDKKTPEGEDNGRIGLDLYEISTDGFVTNTTFSGIPADISGDFNLFRNWSQSGAAILVWRGSSKDKSEARITIYASKVSETNSDNTASVSAPIAAANINLPASTGPDDEGGAFTASYDAYMKGNDLKILTVFGEAKSGELDGSVYLAETQAEFKNTIETAPGVNDISGLMPELRTNFNLQVKNTGFVPITSINVKIGDGESATNTVRVLPNEETTVTATFTPTRNLPDSINYTVTAEFNDGSVATLTDSISLLQTDIAAEILSSMQENGDHNINALISNNTPFSLTGKTVVAGIYEDSFGTIPVSEKEIAGSNFERESMGTSVLVDFTFNGTKDLPQSLYLIAKAYDSSHEEIPDNYSMNNILRITNIVLASATDSYTISGTIKGSDTNSGIAGTFVQLKNGIGSVIATTSANSAGEYTFSNIPAGTYSIEASCTGYNSGTISGVVVLNGNVTGKDLTLTKAGGGTGGGGSTPAPTPKNEASVSGSSGDLKIEVRVSANNASAELTSAQAASGEDVTVAMPKISGVTSYTLGIPVPGLSRDDGNSSITLNTDTGNITLPSNMLSGTDAAGGSKAQIHIGAVKTGDLPPTAQVEGNRPVVSLSLSIDGKTTAWNNPNAPVTVSIPYTPTAEELKNPESIVIWYIDGSGKAVSVPNGRYDPVTKTVTFFTTHFSDYAVAYVPKTFSDLGGVEWARKAIEVMTSKGITGGTGQDTFSPSLNITRGDYLVWLVNTLGLTANVTANFDDVKPGADYYDAVGIAKKLGIAIQPGTVPGGGNNLFNPAETISRQEMMVLAARALEKYQGLKAAEHNTVLEKFTDRDDITDYALSSLATLVNAGLIEDSGNKLNPRSSATRAEAAVFLYNIYNKYPQAPVIPTATLSRLAGQTAIDTALSIARAVYPDKLTNVVLATADTYPDALAGSVLAYQLNAPILLVGSSAGDQAKVIDYLKANLEQEGTVYILGGTAVVGSGMDDKLRNNGFNHITRIAGETRYDTAAKIAEHVKVKEGTPVVLVSGENYPDALAVSSVAAQNQFPILLVQKEGIAEAVSQELAALKPGKIYIIGLEGAISPAVKSQAAKITGLAAENIVRIGGIDRYATSLAIAEYFNLGSRTLCLATGNNFPDALAGSVYAAGSKAPIILTDSSLSAQTADYVESRKPSETTIFGGAAVVGKDIEQQLKKLLKQ